MSRRFRYALVGASLVCCALILLFHFQHRRKSIQNVVLISIDTCRADHLSCYGYKRQTTPNIDALARDGVMFNNALSPVPLTTPAHGSMLTGTYPPTHGVRLNNGDRLADSNITLAEIMRDAGYHTAAFVGGFPLDASFGLNQGFETYDCNFTRKSDKSALVAERSAEEVSRPAMDWLDRNGKNPFLLFLHYYDPHLPYSPPPPYAADYSSDAYAGEIAYVDSWIGHVLNRLRELDVYDNTLVIITGDHGEGLGEHGERAHGFLIYQSTLHVPLVIRVPHNRKGRRVDGNASLVDIVPTVLDLLGLKTPAPVEGISLASCLERGTAPSRAQPIYAESLEASTFDCGEVHGVIDGHWKHILSPRQELYDLESDSTEQNNAIEKQPQMAHQLRTRLEAMLQVMESKTPKGTGPPVDPEAVKRLQSLGYLGGGAQPTPSVFDPTREDAKEFLPTYERLQKAHGLFLSNHSEEATKELLELVKERPSLVTAHAMLAEIAIRDRRLADTAMRCEMIVSILTATNRTIQQLSPTTSDLGGTRLDTHDPATAHFNLAVVLHEMGKPAEAGDHFSEALRLRPDYAEAHFKLGLILQQTGKRQEAIGRYEQALRIKPDYADAHMNLGSLLQSNGKLLEAIGHYEQALRIKPDYADAHYNLARAQQQTGKLKEAAASYERAFTFNPEFVDARNALGAIQIEQGELDKAIGTFRIVLHSSPQNVDAHYRLGVALRKQGKLAEALAHWREGLRLLPGSIFMLNDVSCLLATCPDASIRNGKEAVELAGKAVTLTGGKVPELLDTLAAAYAEAGQFEEAIKTAEQALALAQTAKTDQRSLAAGIQSHINLYRARKPYRSE